MQEELKPYLTEETASLLINDELASVKAMFVLSLKNGRLEDHQIPGATQSRSVTAVDLKIILPPIASYDAITCGQALKGVVRVRVSMTGFQKWRRRFAWRKHTRFILSGIVWQLIGDLSLRESSVIRYLL